MKIYHRKLVKVQQFGYEDISSNSIFEAIEDHYLAQRYGQACGSCFISFVNNLASRYLMRTCSQYSCSVYAR